jgi:hypothetical protein
MSKSESKKPNSRPARLIELAVTLLLFLFVSAAYLSSRGTTPLTDTASTLQVSLSILKQGNVDLDEYSDAPGDSRNAGDVNGHRLYFFPLGTSFAIVPLVALIDWCLQHFRSLDLYTLLKTTPDWDMVACIHRFIASLITALTAVIVYLTGRLFLDRKRSLLLALIFAFCTSAWSTASRDLWQHTTSMLLLSLALFLILLARARPWLVQFAGIPLAFAYTVRPTNSLPILFLTLYVFIEYRRYLPGYLLGAFLIAMPFLLLNRSLWGDWLPPYFRPQRLANNPQFLEALAGNLISPARGLLIYSPVLLFAGYGIVLKMRKSEFSKLDGALLGIFIVHWLAISSFKHWSGGASYGPRFFTDLLPFLIYFLIPVLQEIRMPSTARQWVLGSSLVILVAISFFMHYRGATRPATWDWNGAYLHVVDSVDDDPARLWDWSDPQFWRGLRPAKLAVTPPSICIQERSGDISSQTSISLTVSNNGDQPLAYEIDTPRRMFAEPAERRVPAMGYAEPMVAADVAGYEEGLHSLGGIFVAAVPDKSNKSARNTPVVIPVSLLVLPPSGAPRSGGAMTGDTPCYMPPSDILIDGKTQESASDQIRALHGSGWYDKEVSNDAIWRWAASPSQVYIYSPTQQEVEITATPIALHATGSTQGLGDTGTMRVTTDDGTLNSAAGQIGRPFSIAARLHAGWNVVAFDLEAGNFRPADLDPANGDTRELSFALGPINISAK